jgi:hypothetical protein
VAQRLGGGNPATMGSIAYRCLQGGQGKPLVALRCPSSLGGRGAKVSGDHGVSQVSQRLHAGVSSRHSIRTVPAMFRTPFSHNAAV